MQGRRYRLPFISAFSFIWIPVPKCLFFHAVKRSYNEVSFPSKKDVRSFDQESEYEKAWSSDESEPEDFYDISGMVHRMATTGGGFNYQNPSSTLH
ncbi:hypothetical protein Tco_1130737, partial [Tanacetum coccineum]